MIVRVGANITGLSTGLKNAQKQVKFFGRNVTGSMKEIRGQIAGTVASIGAGFLVKDSIQDAMRFEALMTTLGESMGESRKKFEEWQESAGNAFGYSRLQSADTANLLSLNFKTISSSTEDLVDKTTKMMEIAAVVANKRGMTMQEVSDRIRSAMNQEADGADELGVNVRVASIQMSKAYQEMANGAPWDQLTENMRKTILYEHILEQVTERLGNTMQDTTSLRMAQFSASLADVKMALGQAFLPIVYRVLPILNSMAQALYKVLQVVSAFTRSLFGGGFVYKAPKGFADVAKKDALAVGAIGDASEESAKKSAKSAKKSAEAWKGLFGFDEVNTVKDPSDTADAGGGAGGGGGGGGLGGLGESMVPQEPFKPFEQAIDELSKKMDKYTRPIKETFKTVYDFISTYVKTKLSEISAWWGVHGNSVKQALVNIKNFVKPIFEGIGSFILTSVQMMIDGVIMTFMGIITFLSGVFTGNWKQAWEGIQMIFAGVVEALFGFWNLTFIGGIRKLLVDFLKTSWTKIVKFKDDFIKAFKEAKENIGKFFTDLKNDIVKKITEVKNFIEGKVELMETSFKNFWSKIKKGAEEAWEGIKKVWHKFHEWFAREIITPVVNEMQKIKDAFSEGIGEGFKYLINKVIEGINNGLRKLNKVKNGLPFGASMPDLPYIPKLAQGGITNGPTLAMVGDNVGGREVIAPLDRLQSMLTNSVIQAMQVGGGNGPTNSGDIVLNIDGRSFARIVKPFLDKEQNRVGSDVRIRTI